MDWKKIKSLWNEPSTKDKLGLKQRIIILIAGIALVVLCLPFEEENREEKGTEESTTVEQNERGELEEYTGLLEKRLVKLLEQVAGVGEVSVMITLAESEEKVVLKDIPVDKEVTSEKDSAGGSRAVESYHTKETTIYEQNESGKEVPYVTKEREPVIEGVVVLCGGAEDSAIQSEIIGAVQVLFDVPVHKIKVMKRK